MTDWDVQPGDFSFGRYLQRARLSQRIRLDDLSQATCIGIDNLIRLESDDLDHLPAEVFVVGYIRTYAQAVGADPEEALRRYRSCRQAQEAQLQWESRRARASSRFWLRLGLAICIFAGLIVASIHLMSPASTPPSGPTAALDDATSENAAENSGDTNNTGAATLQGSDPLPSQGDGQTQALPEPETNGHHHYRLDIWAVKDLWLKAIVDDQRAQVYKLKKGDTLHLEALTGINLLIEDSAGVELTLDGVALPIPGKSGQVVNLEIP